MISDSLKNKIVQYLLPYNPVKVAIFGSYARDEQTKDSDLDVLIDFNKPCSLLQFVKIKRELTELIGYNIDLVSGKAITHPKLKKYIEKDMKVIYS
ncbi:MAG: nucleotidyltransferase family protein [Cyclobacteriaceae bacterium]|nr:nucleotidyltransferase family protein [Cyclobacteriaceae bacterium]